MAGQIYRTAYEEALYSLEGEDQSNFMQPAYMVAADTHNVANGNKTFMESAADTVESVSNFIPAMLISGASQLYNIPASVGNLVGGDFEMQKAEDWIAAADSDMAAYYTKNKEAVDLGGFLATSWIPGMAGVKVLNMGQKSLEAALTAGKFGEGTSKALGLLVPQKQKFLKAALEETANNTAAATIINRNAIRAVGQGFKQAALESTFFELGVAVTMYDSPMLEDYDAGDFATNIAFGTLVFGAGMGVIDTVKSYSAAKGVRSLADTKTMPWTHRAEPASASTSYEKLSIYVDDLHETPAIPKEGVTLTTKKGEEVTVTAVTLDGYRNTKIESIENSIRKEVGTIAGGDEAIAEAVYQELKAGTRVDKLGAYVGLKNLARVAEPTPMEARIQRIMEKKPENRTVEELSYLENSVTGYVRVYGEGSGAVRESAPITTALADTLGKNEEIAVNIFKSGAGKVTAGRRTYNFIDESAKPSDKQKTSWDMLTSDPMETQARFMFVEKLPPWEAGTKVTVRESDIPYLDKIYREFDDGAEFIVLSDSGSPISFSSKEELLAFTKRAKDTAIKRLADSSSKGKFLSSPEAMADKLRSITGIDFAVESVATREAVAKSLGLKPGDLRNSLAYVQRDPNNLKFRKIAIAEETLTQRPLHKLVSSLLHEEGHTKFHAIIANGGIPQARYSELKKELIAVSKLAREDSWKAVENIKDPALKAEKLEYLNKIDELMADTFSYLAQNTEQMKVLAPTFDELYGGLVRPLSKEALAAYKVRAQTLTQEELAAMVNVRPSYISGTFKENLADDLFAAQSYNKEYTEKLVRQGSAKADEVVDTRFIPQTVKMDYTAEPFGTLNGHEIENAATIKQLQNVYTQGTALSSAEILGEEVANFPTITSSMIQSLANSVGAGAKLLTAASSNYGSLGSLVENIGKVTTRVIEAKKDAAREVLEPALYKLGNNKAAAIEWATLSNKLRAIPDNYYLNENGDAFIHAETAKWMKEAEKALEEGKEFNKPRPVPIAKDAPMSISIKTKEARELARLHIEVNGKRIDGYVGLRTSQGVQNTRDPLAFYPPPVNSNEYQHFAHVYDSSVTGTGHQSTIYATSAEELAGMVKKLRDDPRLTVRYKQEAEEYYNARGQFEYAKTLNDNYIDTALYRKGVSSSYVVPTDPKKIVDDLMQWHMREESTLVRDAVETKYEIPFGELKKLGSKYTSEATSKFGSLSTVKRSDAIVKNPYMDFIKTALGQRKYSDYPFWIDVNRLAENAISALGKRVSAAAESARSEKDLLAVNSMLEEAGYKGAYYDESMDLFANHRADPALLSKIIRKGNSILATVVLRLDALNAANNAISANVLLGAETKAVIRAIESGDAEAVGALAELTKIKVPGTDKLMFSPAKMIAKSIAKFGRKTPEMEFYRANGWTTTISDQYKATLDDMTFSGTESIAKYDSRLNKVHNRLKELAETGEKWTGNRLAEEFNRFVAADVMKQMTDVAVERGLMTNQEALSYINTFVNRTQGNYMAAQRPMLFQGPVGQAIGLFQTYQFNLMQQLLRHVGEGASKDAMTLLALQGTIHGMNGLPGFNAINTSLIGNAAGNEKHRDIYDGVYDIAGKQAGDWLMYGLASNMLMDPNLKINLYTRGDINPRHVTLVPINPASVPIVQATVRFLGNAFSTLDKLAKGGDLSTTFLQGLEHNGISRPLAGLAQTLEGLNNPYSAAYSTSNRGNVIAANDMLSIVNLARMAGGKPMGEAIALDAAFRFKAYGLKDAKRRRRLGAAIKTTLIAGQEPSQEQLDSFAEQYAATGGKSEQFNSWYLQLYKAANLSQVNKISNDLNSPYSQSMQKIMGGYEMKDFTEGK